MNKLSLSLVFLISLSLVSCEKAIKGTGHIVSETRSLEPFNELELNGIINVSFKQVKSTDLDKVVVSAQENLLPYIKTTIGNGRLIINIERSIHTDKKVLVEIYGHPFRSLVNNGSGDVKSDERLVLQKLYLESNGSGDISLDLDAKNIEVELNGSGDVYFSGSTDYLELINNGSGDLNTIEMRSFEVDVLSNGSGDVSAHAKESFDVEINGSGDVYHVGKAELTKSLRGTGLLKTKK
tara:strand:+ start:535 stop:1248 length:714 start_codon:yes stop_codon:yes gene_type:complete